MIQERDIHRPGRPAEPMDITDARNLLSEYQRKSTRQLAKKYNVSQTAICKRLKKARARIEEAENDGNEATEAKSI